MEDLLFVINVVDFTYQKPIVKVVYAGSDMNKAYAIYHKKVECSDTTQVNLELVQGEKVRRLETHHV